MRLFLAFGLLFSTPIIMCAAKKVISPNTSAGNDQIDVIATISLDEDEVAQKLGADPGKGIVLLSVRVVPKTDTPVQISPDDFILLAHDDGERSKPFEPSEIAGNGALIVSNASTAKSKSTSGFGGFGGMIGAGSGSSPGNSKPVALATKVDENKAGNQKLLDVLKAKELPAKESVAPVEGYLYFPLDGKHKLKNLAILYRGPAGKLDLEFEH
jgi:hypothetical protein